MDAFEIIIYVVIMIIWVIVQNARKKKLKAQQEAQRKASQNDYDQFDEEIEESDPNKRSLVEEIIEELRNENKTEDVEVETTNEYAPTVKRDFSYKESPSNKETENRLAELKSKKKSQESVRFGNYELDKKYIDEGEEDESGVNDYASLIFEDADSPRKAIILSEILNRKHF